LGAPTPVLHQPLLDPATVAICPWKKKRRAGKVRYDFVQRDAEGQLHVYYGVTEEGSHGPWIFSRAKHGRS